MKKTKKPFYAGRIKTLTWMFATIVAAFICIGLTNNSKKELLHGKLPAIGIALVPFAMVKKLKDDGKWDKLDENTKTYVTSLESEINAALTSLKEGILDADAIKKKHDEWMKDYGKGLTDEQQKRFGEMSKAITDQATLIEQLKDSGLSKESKDSLKSKLKENDAKIKEFIKAGRGSGKITIEFNAKAGGADQAPTDIATHTIGLRVEGIGQLPVRKPFMRDLFPVVNCNLEYIKYIDQETVVRDAQNVATAAASTHTSKLTWKERSIQITNVRDLVDVPVNMLEDYDFVQGELNNLININVQLKIDNGLLKDDGVHPNLHSVNEVASEFSAANTLGGTITAWSNSVQDPNIFDLVIAMSSQIIALGQDGSYMPNVVLFNTIDRYKSLLIKDANNNYLMPPFVVRLGNKEYSIDGMIVRSNPNVAANSIYVFDSTKGTIYQRKNAIFEMSYENATNFETEVATLKGYERLNLLIRNVNKNAFMKCTDVQTALVALAA